MISSFISNYFGFNKQQRNGLFVLVLMSFSLLIIRLVFPYFIKPSEIIIKNLPLLEKQLDSSYKASTQFAKADYHKEETAREFFMFDPNSVSYEQLLKLGFKDKTAKIFVKFRNKGFQFKEKQELKKVYGISENFYAKLEPYILIESKQLAAKKIISSEEIKQPAVIIKSQQASQTRLELNSTDSVALVALNGIGPSFTKRILKYRGMLGGFVAIDQLKEVYGFTDELFDKIKANIYVDTKFIKKLNLNKDEFKVINKHPYLSYELTKSIFDWRRKTTINVTNLKDILNDPILYQKLLPYLTFD